MEVLQVPSADLAYLGDSVMELLVREHLIRQGHSGAGRLNVLARDYVTAIRQAQAADRIFPLLNETEEGVFRRARNHGKLTPPPSASIAEYRKATALEALFAYLYLMGNQDRMRELFEIGYPSENLRDE